MDSGQGGSIKFVLCAIDTCPVCSNSNYTEEVIKEETPKEAELGLVNLAFPNAVQLLEDPCILIGDMAAMVHMTLHAVGMVPDQKDRLRGQTITVGNVVTTMHGTVKGQMVNKNGISVGTAVLNYVAYSTQMKYSLCSISRLMEYGWKMKGDDKGILMVKKGNKLVFDIIIRMQIVFCFYIQ